GTPNSAGAVFSIGAFAAWIHVRCFPERKVLFAALGIISALGLLSTFSRGALIGCVCACIVLLVQRSDGCLRRRVLAAGLVLIPIVILAPVHDATSLLRIGQGSEARLEAVQSAWSLVRQHAFAGIGQYTFQDESGDLRGRPGAAWTPHNGLLKAL